MSINAKKSLHVYAMVPVSGTPVTCSIISTTNGREIRWADSVRYLGIYMSAKNFSCSLTNAKKSFYRACQGIF